MTLSLRDQVRLRASDKSTITRETAIGDGETTVYKLQNRNILTSPVPRVWRNDVLQVENTDYTIDYENGLITFPSSVTTNDELVFEYYWSIFSDIEVDQFLADSGSNVTIAAAYLLMTLAADASRLAKREAMSGGGGLGSITKDTAVTARELRETAQAMVEMEGQIGVNIPAEGITEVAWTEHSYQQLFNQKFIRD